MASSQKPMFAAHAIFFDDRNVDMLARRLASESGGLLMPSQIDRNRLLANMRLFYSSYPDYHARMPYASEAVREREILKHVQALNDYTVEHTRNEVVQIARGQRERVLRRHFNPVQKLPVADNNGSEGPHSGRRRDPLFNPQLAIFYNKNPPYTH